MESRSIYSPLRSMPPSDLRSPTSLSPKEPPACVQNAMFGKERQPFTYTPGGLDLSEIRSEKMAKRLIRNAMSPGVQEKPKPPSFPQTNNNPNAPKSCHYYSLPVALFPNVQIPTNPKQLLRRTSGPYCRSESVESQKETPPKVEETNVNGHDNSEVKTAEIITDKSLPEKVESEECEQIDDVEVTFTINVSNKGHTKISSEDDVLKEEIDKSYSEEIPECKNELESNESSVNESVEEEKIENVIECIDVEDKLEVEEIPNIISENDEIILDVEVEVEEQEYCDTVEEECVKSDEVQENECAETTEYIKEDIENLNDDIKDLVENVSDESESVVEEEIYDEPKNIVIENVLDEPKSIVIENVKEEPTNVIIESIKEEIENIVIENMKETNENDAMIESDRVMSPSRRGLDMIKGDLDKLPTLNICTKRFSFLRESPEREEPKEDDPFSIITGIPPKISLIDRKDKVNEVPKSYDVKPTWKKPETETYNLKSEPVNNNPKYIIEKNDSLETIGKKVESFVTLLKDDLRAVSQCTKEEDVWKKDHWNTLARKESLTLKDIIKEDPEPAWKKEIREITIRKAEAKEETKEYKAALEEQTRKEWESTIQTKETKAYEENNTSKLWNNYNTYNPPWSEQIMNNQTWSNEPKTQPWNNQSINPKDWSPSYYEPLPQEKNTYIPSTWSQTLRPKSWKERSSDTSNTVISGWDNTMPRASVADRFLSRVRENSGRRRTEEVRKTPEITVEVVNQQYHNQPYIPPSTNNGYIHPWESSSESSVAFSPEPRTPTPQSRGSPFTLSSQYPGYNQQPFASREYGTIGYQPKRRLATRSCPIQSRSFKYLQLLTGTVDSYEDDEPFIPQPPQHAYPRPGNF